MKYRALGGTGIKVSPLALGALALGSTMPGIGNNDAVDSERIVRRALDAGINFVDTADRYSGGASEEVVGRALRGRRDEVVLATKVNGPMGADPNQQGNSRRWIITEVEHSLRRLQTDWIDLYQIHRPDPDTDVEETLSALTDLLASGKVRAIGSSSMPASDIVEAQWVAERRGLARFRTEQPQYSILDRGIEREVLPVTERHGMGVLTWSPLAKGALTGRIRRGQQSDLSRMRLFPQMAGALRVDAIEQLIVLADEMGVPLTHLAIAFTIAHPGVTSVLLGPSTSDQLDDLLAAADLVLDDAVLDRIDEIVPPGTDLGERDASFYRPPSLTDAALRRRPLGQRAAA